MKETFDIANLIEKHIKGVISTDENIQLNAWIEKNAANKELFQKLTNTQNQLSYIDKQSSYNKENVWNRIDEELFPSKKLQTTYSTLTKYAAAIMLPLMLGLSIFLFTNKNKSDITIANIDKHISPGTQKAVLILSDGQEIDLNAVQQVTDNNQTEVQIDNSNELLSYSDANKKPIYTKPVYNELKTPNGGTYSLKLADGSTVWLNAGSSLRFPISFTDSVRKVYLDGEGYFDIAHNGKPFIVSSGQQDIRVLGTQFNVTAYSADAHTTTTLVKGKVMIRTSGSDKNEMILNPNEQSVAHSETNKLEKQEVNTSIYTSWINGKIEFYKEPLESVMKKLARWYDFEYNFINKEAANYHFSARLNNTDSISDILKMLEMTTNVEFNINDNKIEIK